MDKFHYILVRSRLFTFMSLDVFASKEEEGDNIREKERENCLFLERVLKI